MNAPATTDTNPLSLHDALPISRVRDLRNGGERVASPGAEHPDRGTHRGRAGAAAGRLLRRGAARRADRKSTRLNSSHPSISYAVFCLKKKKTRSSWD